MLWTLAVPLCSVAGTFHITSFDNSGISFLATGGPPEFVVAGRIFDVNATYLTNVCMNTWNNAYFTTTFNNISINQMQGLYPYFVSCQILSRKTTTTGSRSPVTYYIINYQLITRAGIAYSFSKSVDRNVYRHTPDDVLANSYLANANSGGVSGHFFMSDYFDVYLGSFTAPMDAGYWPGKVYCNIARRTGSTVLAGLAGYGDTQGYWNIDVYPEGTFTQLTPSLIKNGAAAIKIIASGTAVLPSDGVITLSYKKSGSSSATVLGNATFNRT